MGMNKKFIFPFKFRIIILSQKNSLVIIQYLGSTLEGIDIFTTLNIPIQYLFISSVMSLSKILQLPPQYLLLVMTSTFFSYYVYSVYQGKQLHHLPSDCKGPFIFLFPVKFSFISTPSVSFHSLVNIYLMSSALSTQNLCQVNIGTYYRKMKEDCLYTSLLEDRFLLQTIMW